MTFFLRRRSLFCAAEHIAGFIGVERQLNIAVGQLPYGDDLIQKILI